jgi:hypothetical protein
MSQAKATLRPRRRRKAGPTLGAAGLSLSLAGGASAAAGAAIADMPVCSSVAVSYELTLAEEEITDVGLATFSIADKESTLQFRTRIAAGGCGACGSGFYSQPTNNSQPRYNGPTNGPSPSARKPTRSYVHTPPPQQVPKNQNQNASRAAQPKASAPTMNQKAVQQDEPDVKGLINQSASPQRQPEIASPATNSSN